LPARVFEGRIARAAALSLALAFALSLLLLALRDRLSTANIALLYLLPVLTGATLGGLVSGVVASVACVLAFDLLFIPPYGTLSVASGQDVLTLLLYLAVGALAAELAGRARMRAEEAGRRAAANALLYDLSTALLAGELPAILQAMAERIARAFGLSSCCILLPDEGGALQVRACGGAPEQLDAGEHARQVAAVAEWAYRQGEVVALALNRSAQFGDRVRRRSGDRPAAMPGEALLFVPLRSGAETQGSIGLLRLVRPADRPLTDEDTRMLTAFGAQAALAVERAQLATASAEAVVLRESDRAKTALLSNVSHELRTPLTTIRVAAESLLQEDVRLDEATRVDLLVSVRDESERLGGLVANLLDLSRLEAGALRLERHLYDLGEIVGGVTARLASRLSRHAVEVEVDPAVGLVLVDYALMDQVVANLLDNAAKYAPEGTAIWVEVVEDGQEVVMRVKDGGPGIPPAAQERVFDRFYRHPQAVKGTTGTGLGLAICKAVVEAHGGRIWIEAGQASGTTVCVVLPRAPLDGVSGQTASPA
jgi:two-component system sensor histidine kinase KdpD